MQFATQPIFGPCSTTLPTMRRGPVNVMGLEPARVLEALINAPLTDGHGKWRPISFAEAQAMTGHKNRWSIPRWGDHMLRISYNNGVLYGLGYDALFDEMHSSQVMARLRSGESFEVSHLPPRLRASAKAFTPMMTYCAAAPEGPPIMGPMAEKSPQPKPAEAPQIFANQFVLPPKEVLQVVLPGLFDDAWYRQELVPELLDGAGKAMTANAFVNFFYLRISRAGDSAINTALAERLMDFSDNAVLRALLPDEDAHWAVGARMMATREPRPADPALWAPKPTAAMTQHQHAKYLLELLEQQ